MVSRSAWVGYTKGSDPRGTSMLTEAGQQDVGRGVGAEEGVVWGPEVAVVR